MSVDDLQTRLKEVRDEASFLNFLAALSDDWERACRLEARTPSSPYASIHGWENTDIGSFFEAAVAAARAGAAVSAPEDDANIWRIAATILYRGKAYE
ncbi:MAG: hypothetical protein AAF844_21250 [Pseudomonadota bacterium]